MHVLCISTGHQFQLLWSPVCGTLGKTNNCFLRLSFRLPIVVRIQRDKLGKGFVPLYAQQMRGAFSPMSAFLTFLMDFVGAAFVDSDLYSWQWPCYLKVGHTSSSVVWNEHIFRRAEEETTSGELRRFQSQVASVILCSLLYVVSLQGLTTVIA